MAMPADKVYCNVNSSEAVTWTRQFSKTEQRSGMCNRTPAHDPGHYFVQRVIYSAVSTTFEGRSPPPPQSPPGLDHTVHRPSGQSGILAPANLGSQP